MIKVDGSGVITRTSRRGQLLPLEKVQILQWLKKIVVRRNEMPTITDGYLSKLPKVFKNSKLYLPKKKPNCIHPLFSPLLIAEWAFFKSMKPICRSFFMRTTSLDLKESPRWMTTIFYLMNLVNSNYAQQIWILVRSLTVSTILAIWILATPWSENWALFFWKFNLLSLLFNNLIDR